MFIIKMGRYNIFMLLINIVLIAACICSYVLDQYPGRLQISLLAVAVVLVI